MYPYISDGLAFLWPPNLVCAVLSEPIQKLLFANPFGGFGGVA